MHFTLTEEQRLLRDTVRDLLAAQASGDSLPDVVSSRAGMDTQLYGQLAGLGLTGLTLPERYGGADAGFVELALVLEECGYAAAPVPLLETAVASELLARADADEARRLLPGVVRGEAILSLGLASGPYVNHAENADLLVLEADGQLYAVDPDETKAVAQPAIDGLRRLSRIHWTPKPSDQPLGGATNDELRAFALDAAALCSAAMLVGIGQRAVDLAVAYAKEREQFGRPIGTFQAVKHQLAEATLQLEFARPLVYRGALTLGDGGERRAVDTSLAKAFASEAAEQATRTSLQVHGAIGYTWEHDLHLWIKSALSLARAWGDARWHRDRIGRYLFLAAGAAE